MAQSRHPTFNPLCNPVFCVFLLAMGTPRQTGAAARTAQQDQGSFGLDTQGPPPPPSPQPPPSQPFEGQARHARGRLQCSTPNYDKMCSLFDPEQLQRLHMPRLRAPQAQWAALGQAEAGRAALKINRDDNDITTFVGHSRFRVGMPPI